MSIACTLSADASFTFNGNGTITETATGNFVANYTVATAGVVGTSTPTFNTTEEALRISNTYDADEAVAYTIAITGVDAGFVFTGLDISSSDLLGNFSLGPAVTGISVDQQSTLTADNTSFRFTSAAGAAATGDVFAAGTVLSSTDTGRGANDIFTLSTGDAATQVFTYASLNGVGLAADSFQIAANFDVVPLPEPSTFALLGLGGLALLLRRRR